ncbi:MAG: hypothetical protein HQK86_01655 [Nitrospinae bacterium]|nr:hypothetical protein [Nitrospinota bacterium]
MVVGNFSPRTAFIVFASLFIFLRIFFPYTLFNSDVANYGYMGNDIINYGYIPSIPYGQNYLFPVTPYLYALYRVILPSSICDVYVMTAAGGTLSLLGFWMVYESFILAMRTAGKDPLLPGIVFLAFLALSPVYQVDIMENSGQEIAIFTLGALAFMATLMESGIRRSGSINPAHAFIFGLTWVYSSYARPQIAVYGAMFFIALSAVAWKTGKWRMTRGLALFTVVGGVAGYVPMALHKIFRAPQWPFTLKSNLGLGSYDDMQDRLWLVTHKIFHFILSLIYGVTSFSIAMSAIVVVSLAIFAVAVIRRRGETPLVAAGLFWGSAIIVVAMILVPGLSMNADYRRYCLHSYLAFAFIFASAIPFRHVAVRSAMALAVAVTLILSVPVWSRSLADEVVGHSWIEDVKAMIPVLAARKKVIMADYWDAYLLGFMAEGKLTIEVFPWQVVRRYGSISEDRMREGAVWLIREGHGGTVQTMIQKELRAPREKMALFIPMFGKRYAYVEYTDPAIAADFMKKTRPDYFTVKYPPGS